MGSQLKFMSLMWCLAVFVPMLLVCIVQPMSCEQTKYTHTPCKDKTNLMDCRLCCKQDNGFQNGFMDWDGCYCHNELHRSDPKDDQYDW